VSQLARDQETESLDSFKEKYAPLSLPEGTIAFYGNVRVFDDGGADEFRIELNGRQPLFGEWRHWYRKKRE
jgi:hypothetical protein